MQRAKVVATFNGYGLKWFGEGARDGREARGCVAITLL